MTTTFIKTKSATPMGTYQPTAVDAQKAAATILVQACDGGSFSIASKVELAGRGIKRHAGNNYSVTERALDTLKREHTWAPDF